MSENAMSFSVHHILIIRLKEEEAAQRFRAA